MNYQVLARKWRPHNFTEVVGQEHVVKSLINALQHSRLHHAYLFTGTRGVGKTTIARILAKAINCENLQDFNPGGICPVCVALDEGRFLDLIEVDGASRTKVEDTRDLLDNVQYAPNQGRYKVYLIDEVHMLSGHSFNALLKTLEEPPAHVKFLLATTDPHKIPVTVLSRCLQFNLKHLQPTQVFSQMCFILEQEQLDYEPAALKILARAADGSMRDGLSLLDQAIVFGNGKVTLQDVNSMLGTIAQQPIERLLAALAASDAPLLFEIIHETADIQSDFKDMLQQMLQTLHRIALFQYLPNLVAQDLDAESLVSLASALPPEDVQLYYQIGLMGQKDLDLAPDPRSGFEMLLLRMLTFKPATSSHQPPQKSVKAKPPAPSAPVSSNIVHLKLPPQPSVAAPAPITNVGQGDRWMTMIADMKLESVTKQLANNCQLDHLDEKSCVLLLDAAHQSLLTPARLERLQKALQVLHGTALKLTVTPVTTDVNTPAIQQAKQREDQQQAAVEAIHSDENVRTLTEHFDAQIIPGSIEPV